MAYRESRSGFFLSCLVFVKNCWGEGRILENLCEASRTKESDSRTSAEFSATVVVLSLDISILVGTVVSLARLAHLLMQHETRPRQRSGSKSSLDIPSHYQRRAVGMDHDGCHALE